MNIRLCSCGLLYRFGGVVYDYMRDVSPQLTGQYTSWQAVAPSEMLFTPSTCPDTKLSCKSVLPVSSEHTKYYVLFEHVFLIFQKASNVHVFPSFSFDSALP